MESMKEGGENLLIDPRLEGTLLNGSREEREKYEET